MTISDRTYAAQVFAFTAILALVIALVLLGIGIASLVSSLLGGGAAASVVVFSLAGALLGFAGHLNWLRRKVKL
jgi:hypothetical protein